MSIKVVIFDFDGTIADTYDTFVTIVNQLAGEFGYKPINLDELDRLKNLSSREIVQQSDISLVQIPFLLTRIKDELAEKIVNLGTFPGLKNCLFQLKKRGIVLGIITSNSQDNVHTFLTKNNLINLFDFIYSGTSLFGKHKIINQMIKKHHFNPNEVVYVGDETRDINSAKKSNIKVIAVGWGFNSPQVLAKYNPDHLVYHPHHLLAAVGSFADDYLQVL
jgi:phosphoglycolate phosphatase